MTATEYTPAKHPKMFRGGRMTGAAFVRESRRLSHQESTLQFQVAMYSGDTSGYRASLEKCNALQTDLYLAYKAGR